MRVVDLFSGIGGFSLGLERAGLTTVAFCESDEKCRRVLRHHWPEVPIYEDVRELPYIECEVLCGGFPCQPFSSASRGRANAQDLWPAMLRAVDTLRPRWVLAENVPGLGLDGVDRVCADLEGADYSVWPMDLDTSPPGRSRGRRRFFFLAHTNREGEPRRPVNAEVAGLRRISGERPDHLRAVGVDDGLPRRMDRLRQLGNAVTPDVAQVLGSVIRRLDAVA